MCQAGRRVLSVDRRSVNQGSESFWSFCGDYLESSQRSGVPGKNGAGSAILAPSVDGYDHRRCSAGRTAGLGR